MVDTSYAVPAERQARLPTLHLRVGDGTLGEQPQGAPVTPTPPFTGDGGLYSTAQDYGRFMRMFLNGGELDGVRILSEESVVEMGRNQIGEAFVELQVPPNPSSRMLRWASSRMPRGATQHARATVRSGFSGPRKRGGSPGSRPSAPAARAWARPRSLRAG